MISENGTTETHSMEGKCQEPKEVTEMNESAPISNSMTFDFSRSPYSNEKSSRLTEDIYMREDEDGVLSHFCPLDKDRDGVRDEEEDFPDAPPTMVDYLDWIKDGCSLDSEEIPYLLAEPPLKSEESLTDNTEVSNIDSSTSMIYPLVQNQQFIQKEDKELQRLLQDRKQSPSFQTLDKNILDAWSEVSTDEEFYVPIEDDEEMLNIYGLGNESDMEEFETNDIENEVSEFVRDKIHPKAVCLEEDSLRNHPEEEPGKSMANELSNENFGVVKVEGSEQGTSNIETRDEEKDASESKEDAHDKSDGYNKQNDSFKSDDDQVQIELLKSEVENAMIEAAVSLNLSAVKLQETLSNDLTIVADGVEINKVVAPLEDSNETEDCKMRCEHHEKELSLKKDQEKHEGNKPNEDCFAGKIKTKSSDSQMEIKANFIPNSKEEKQENFSMEPVAMNLPRSTIIESVAMNLTRPTKTEEEQPDLKTALRFMTEVYHSKDDDYLCLDSLSDMDVPLDNKPKAVVKGLDDKPVELLVNLKSPKKSINFEAEETKPVTGPRNRLTKLFSSFKKKLGKKA